MQVRNLLMLFRQQPLRIRRLATEVEVKLEEIQLLSRSHS
jgi:hypothetical protein